MVWSVPTLCSMPAQHKAEVLTQCHGCHVQAEKEVMMDSVRMLQQQLALKDLVIQAFIPPPEVQKVGARPPLTVASVQGPFLCAVAAERIIAAPGAPNPHPAM